VAQVLGLVNRIEPALLSGGSEMIGVVGKHPQQSGIRA
jgi:hypothetical protein